MSGFGKTAGPAGPPLSQPRFGNFTTPTITSTTTPPPPFSLSAPLRSPWVTETQGTIRSPSLVYERSNLPTTSGQSIGNPRNPLAQGNGRSPPMSFERLPPPTSFSPAYSETKRTTDSPHVWVNGQSSFLNDDAQTNPRQSAMTSLVATHNSGTSITAKISRFQDLKWSRSPPQSSVQDDISRISSHTSIRGFASSSDLPGDDNSYLVSSRIRSPTFAFAKSIPVGYICPPFNEGQLPVLSPASQSTLPMIPRNNPNLLANQKKSGVRQPHGNSYNSGRTYGSDEVAQTSSLEQSRLQPVQFRNDDFHDDDPFIQKESKRVTVSPPRLGLNSSVFSITPETQIPLRALSSISNTTVEANTTRNISFSHVKRSRSPPSPAVDKVFQGRLHSTQDDIERETEAKARRLARFKQELSVELDSSPGVGNQKGLVRRIEHVSAERQQASSTHPIESSVDMTNGSMVSDFEGTDTSNIIAGLCEDMCPESERAERERKGDLDQYERLDGDRNQTSKHLAVKKYNRTAEREASLIRPMPILQKTVDYLLSLLDQPYDDRFLGMYNFLWDRMRAIRMDLRMQHIFNQEAITILEQMIRLHIIAMHELCEFTKGEGFSEGFDAHLNIEQMNKTSVELFQIYDDHRKKGINMPTEKEFRGYYALLKLDKHPGYKVEPAELSLDLAKMTPEIRQTPEVLFARDVARACRTGNFVAFFRHARKATYLQACLMHAHFAKVRTHALASLHSSQQSNQGIPVSHVAEWLAMEGEDMETLLEYHGFSIREFEEPYMVKEGPFLNADNDYPTKCSKLVHLEKSGSILEDISPSSVVAFSPAKETNEIKTPMFYNHRREEVPLALIQKKSSVNVIDEEMSDFDVPASPKFAQVQPMSEQSNGYGQGQHAHPVTGSPIWSQSFSSPHISGESQLPKLAIPPVGFSSPFTSPGLQPSKPGFSPTAISSPGTSHESHVSKHGFAETPGQQTPSVVTSLERPTLSAAENMMLLSESTKVLQRTSSGSKYGPSMEIEVPQLTLNVVPEEDVNHEIEDEATANPEDQEIALGKLKLIARLWRRRTAKLRRLREERLIAANAALSSMSLGPQIHQTKDHTIHSSEFDIDRLMRERHQQHEKSWSRLNVSDIVLDVLEQRNPNARCLCWKTLLCSPANGQGFTHVAASQWLFSKLMPAKEIGCDVHDDDLPISSPNLSLWKKWVPSQAGDDLTCCLSVVKDINGDHDEIESGVGAVLFLASERIPWHIQKAQLHGLISLIPPESCLPLLLLSDSYIGETGNGSSTTAAELDLHGIDKTRVGKFLVVSLVGDKQTDQSEVFFSDIQLREGLRWLASESPLQPHIRRTRILDLVQSHLNPSLDALGRISLHELSPNHCISAFNDALDWSLEEISAAVQENPSGWPCPEIALLESVHDEIVMIKKSLPSVGWSSPATIEPLFCALRDCKLPSFPYPTSFLRKGANTFNQIENLRSELEDYLIGYLTQTSGILGFPFSQKEARLMVQKNVRLELHDSSYYVIPQWVVIFKRIFNWQLTSLSSGVFSSAYVLDPHNIDPAPWINDELVLEENVYSPYLTEPSLDEMIDVSCSPLLSASNQAQYSPPRVPNIELSTACGLNSHSEQPDLLLQDQTKQTRLYVANQNDMAEDRRHIVENGDMDNVNAGCNPSNGETGVSTMATKDADNLSRLLEQCSMVQNSNADKLYIYF